MVDFGDAIAQHTELSEAAQKKAGQATGTDMHGDHKDFLGMLIAALDRKEIIANQPDSFKKQATYDALSEEQKSKADFAILNVSDQVRRIEDYYRSTKTPNASPQLQTMIDHLWDMKSRIEAEHGSILKI